MDGRMDKFIHAHMPEGTKGFHYLIPIYYTWDQWLLSTFHQRIQKHMLTFSILSVPRQIYTGFIIMLYFGITFSDFFLNSLSQKASGFSYNQSIKMCYFIQHSLRDPKYDISSSGCILSCKREGFISAVDQRKALIL